VGKQLLFGRCPRNAAEVQALQQAAGADAILCLQVILPRRLPAVEPPPAAPAPIAFANPLAALLGQQPRLLLAPLVLPGPRLPLLALVCPLPPGLTLSPLPGLCLPPPALVSRPVPLFRGLWRCKRSPQRTLRREECRGRKCVRQPRQRRCWQCSSP